MDHYHDDGAAIFAELMRRDPFRADYEKGVRPWPEHPSQRRKRAGPVRLTLRMPAHLHEQAERASARGGMSLSTFFVGAIAKAVGEELGHGRDG